MRRIKSLLSAFVMTFASVILLAAPASAAGTVVITGNTSSGENVAGWLFGRDVANRTPYIFNNNEAAIGDGSLYVKPIGATAAHKFIAENFMKVDVDDVDSISYDFLIAGNGDADAADQFYMNVYANIDDSNNYFDCRFDYLPSDGSTEDFKTASFAASDTADIVSKRGTRIDTCPATLGGMPEGSHVRAFSINVGDTSANDQGLAGYLDNVVVNINGDSTTYDFEPVKGEITSPTPGQNVKGIVDFTATYDDGDSVNDDGVQWAIRKNVCTASTNTIFGNVDGKTTPYNWDGSSFSASIDTSELDLGQYCFVFNPSDDANQIDIRKTVLFNVVENAPDLKEECKKDGWATFTSPSFKNQGQCVSFVAKQQRFENTLN